MKAFIEESRAAIIENARSRVKRRTGPAPTEDELAGIPLFLDQLLMRLERRDGPPALGSSPDIEETAPARGRSFLHPGIRLAHIVSAYGAICQSVSEIATKRHVALEAADYQILNQALDDAIAGALTEYSFRREEHRASEERAYIGMFAHELRNSLASVVVAVALLKKGQIPSAGKTMDVIDRNLSRAQNLIDISLAGVRLAAADLVVETFSLRALLDDVELPAASESERRGLQLIVRVEADVKVSGDRHLLVAAVSNLVQNALKFTPSGGTVVIHARATETLTTIFVEDECGGLPPGDAEKLFEPFVQAGRDRSGVGLGLPIVRRAIEAHGGHVSVQDHPGTGCRFTLEIPNNASTASSS